MIVPCSAAFWSESISNEHGKISGRQRQPDCECRSAAFLAGDDDGSAVLFYDLLRAGQPDAGPRDPFYNVRASTKAKKNMLEIGGRNPEAIVLHLNDGPPPGIVVFGGQRNTDITARWTELNRVCEQVRQGPLDA